jgi:flagellar biosynthesis/type III secretory pathway protein FliH
LFSPTRHVGCTVGVGVTTPSKILKAAAPLPARRIPAAVHDADGTVRGMIAAAEVEARRIRETAAAEREAVRAAAEAEGRREGLARAAAALAAAGAARDQLLARAEREVVALALEVARRVLGRELAEGASTVVELAARALAEVRERREVVLRACPADVASLRGSEDRLAATLVRARLEVRGDPTLRPGEVVLDTEAGCLDGGIEAQLAHFSRALEEALLS